MKILHVITGLETGGAERMLVKLVEHTNETFQHTVLSLGGRGTQSKCLEKLGVDVQVLNLQSPAKSLGSLFRLVRIFRTIDYDLVHGWMYHGNLAAYIGVKLTFKKPVIFSIRQSIRNIYDDKITTRMVIKLNSKLSNSVDKVIFNSNVSLSQHIKRGFSTDNSFVIPNGFNIQKFNKDKLAGMKIRKEFSINDTDILFGIVGRNDPKKDYMNFLKAAFIVNQKVKNSHFMIIGRDVDKDVNILNFIVDNGIRDKFTLGSQREDIESIWNAVDIAVSSSRDEGFPNVIGEAMSCGKPCVVTDVGDSSFLVADTGIVVNPNNPKALAGAMIKLATLDRDELYKLGDSARARIVNTFDIKMVSLKYSEMYNKIGKS